MIRFETVKTPKENYFICSWIYDLTAFMNNKNYDRCVYYSCYQRPDGHWQYDPLNLKECFSNWTPKQNSNFLKEDKKIKDIIYKKFFGQDIIDFDYFNIEIYGAETVFNRLSKSLEE